MRYLKSIPQLSPSAEEKFWKRVDRRGTDECWPWLGARKTSGHGVTSIRGQLYLAHRIAYKLSNGNLVQLVCHRCDNPPCCNPNHLFDGDYKDNAIDAKNKGRLHKTIKQKPKMQKLNTRLQTRDIPGMTESDIKRLWKHISVRSPNECWPWLGGTKTRGYGVFALAGSVYMPHRIVYKIHYGNPSNFVCHKCDNTSCCNPDHLFDGTAKDNIHDAIAKGRFRQRQEYTHTQLVRDVLQIIKKSIRHVYPIRK